MTYLSLSLFLQLLTQKKVFFLEDQKVKKHKKLWDHIHAF